MLNFDDAAATAPLLARWLGEPEPDPAWFEGEGSVDGDGVYLKLYFKTIKYAQTTGQLCPVLLHPKLCGVEGRQVVLEMADGSQMQCWVDRTSDWLPKHTVRQRANGRECQIINRSMPIKSVQVISNFARIKQLGI